MFWLFQIGRCDSKHHHGQRRLRRTKDSQNGCLYTHDHEKNTKNLSDGAFSNTHISFFSSTKLTVIKKIILKPNTILISNHYSNFDPFFIQMRFLFKDIRFVTLRDVKKKLHLRFIAWLFNAVYVDPSRADVTFFKEAMSALKKWFDFMHLS